MLSCVALCSNKVAQNLSLFCMCVQQSDACSKHQMRVTTLCWEEQLSSQMTMASVQWALVLYVWIPVVFLTVLSRCVCSLFAWGDCCYCCYLGYVENKPVCVYNSQHSCPRDTEKRSFLTLPYKPTPNSHFRCERISSRCEFSISLMGSFSDSTVRRALHLEVCLLLAVT